MKRDLLRDLASALDAGSRRKPRAANTVIRETAITASKEAALAVKKELPIHIADVPNFEINLKVRFDSKKEQAKGKHRDKQVEPQEKTKPPIIGLDKEMIEFLEDLEPKLIRWLSESRKNAVLFLVDPVRALIESRLIVDPERIARLRRLRRKIPSRGKVPRSFQITHVEIDVEQE